MSLVLSFLWLSWIPLIIFQLLFVVSLWALMLVFVFCFRHKWLFLIVAILSLVCAFLLSINYYMRSLRFISLVKSQELKVGPGSMYHEVGQLDERDFLRIINECDGWGCVENKKFKGWLILKS